MITLFAAFTAMRCLRRDGWAMAKARFGFGADLPLGRHVWLHAASNGELASVHPILNALHEIRPDLHWVITCNTATGMDLARSWSLERVSVRPAPFDLGWATRRLMRKWSVVAHIALESELWPHRMLACPGPVILLGARMRTRTASVWARLPRLSRRVFACVQFVSAQDDESRRNLASLKVAASAMGPVVDLKAFYDAPDIAVPADLRTAFLRETTWCAASTHPGEDEIVLAAHQTALVSTPDLKLILVPRHPDRGTAVAALVVQAGLRVAQRSLRQDPQAAQVYVADTMGEMPLWYQLSGRVFVGGSLVARGGHTPYEPAAYGAALLHGPDIGNFRAPYKALHTAKAAVRIEDAPTLADGLLDLRSARMQDDMGMLARGVLAPQVGAQDFITSVADALPPVVER